jgi:hypothetical protein
MELPMSIVAVLAEESGEMVGWGGARRSLGKQEEGRDNERREEVGREERSSSALYILRQECIWVRLGYVGGMSIYDVVQEMRNFEKYCKTYKLC